jgi:hypothetical protein
MEELIGEPMEELIGEPMGESTREGREKSTREVHERISRPVKVYAKQSLGGGTRRGVSFRATADGWLVFSLP